MRALKALPRRASRRCGGGLVHPNSPRAVRQCFAAASAADCDARRLRAYRSPSARVRWRDANRPPGACVADLIMVDHSPQRLRRSMLVRTLGHGIACQPLLRARRLILTPISISASAGAHLKLTESQKMIARGKMVTKLDLAPHAGYVWT